MRIEEIKNDLIIKYKESRSEKLGRYLVSAKKLSSGEVILRDNPVVVGAASFNGNYLCFSCFRVIRTSSISLSCRKCKVAIFCSTACEVTLISNVY